MANVSNATGTIRFEHPNANTDLIEELIDYGNENVYYGSLIFGERFSPQFGELWSWEWDEVFDFDSDGRWTFYNTISSYFEGFNDAPFKDEVAGMKISVDYVDFEPGAELFVKDSVVIDAVLVDGELTTREHKYVTNDIERTAQIFENYHVTERAFDTITEYGVANYKSYVSQFMAVEPNAFDDNPALRELALNISKIPTNDLLKAFRDQEVVRVTDYEDGEVDDYYITELLIEDGVIDHELIKPYSK